MTVDNLQLIFLIQYRVVFYPIRSDIGVSLYRKDYADGQPDFVQVVDLTKAPK